jgi:hypothetical protein
MNKKGYFMSSWIVTFILYKWGDLVDNELKGNTYHTKGRKKFMQHFVQETSRDRLWWSSIYFRTLSLDDCNV